MLNIAQASQKIKTAEEKSTLYAVKNFNKFLAVHIFHENGQYNSTLVFVSVKHP